MKSNLIIAIVLSLALVSFDFVRAADTIKPLQPSAFCKKSGLTPADGTQLKQPNCVSLEIGEIPAVNNMVSALIINPKNGQTLAAGKAFNVDTKVQGLTTGFFSDPAVDYYQIQQTLDGTGRIQGHSHITIQSLTPGSTNPPDPQTVAFFKGLNDKAVDGVLSVAVTTGLPKGQFRICTMNASNSHQPVVMPVAQRGAQDDCIRVNVV